MPKSERQKTFKIGSKNIPSSGSKKYPKKRYLKIPKIHLSHCQIFDIHILEIHS